MVASRSSDNALSFGGQPLNLPLDKSQFRTFKKKFKLASDINGAWQHHLHDIRHNIIKKFKQPNFLLAGIHHLNQPTSNFKANWMLRDLQKAWAAQSRNKDKLFTRSISRTKLKEKLGERSKGKWERSWYYFSSNSRIKNRSIKTRNANKGEGYRRKANKPEGHCQGSQNCRRNSCRSCVFFAWSSVCLHLHRNTLSWLKWLNLLVLMKSELLIHPLVSETSKDTFLLINFRVNLKDRENLVNKHKECYKLFVECVHAMNSLVLMKSELIYPLVSENKCRHSSWWNQSC